MYTYLAIYVIAVTINYIYIPAQHERHINIHCSFQEVLKHSTPSQAHCVVIVVVFKLCINSLYVIYKIPTCVVDAVGQKQQWKIDMNIGAHLLR